MQSQPQPPPGPNDHPRSKVSVLLSRRYRTAKASFLLWFALFAAAFVVFLQILSDAAVAAFTAGLLGFLVGVWLLLGALLGGVLWALFVQLHMLARDVAAAIGTLVCEAAGRLEERFDMDAILDIDVVNSQIEGLLAAQTARLGEGSALLPVLRQWAPAVLSRGLRFFAVRVVGKSAEDGRITVTDLVAAGERFAGGAALGTVRRFLWTGTLLLLAIAVLWILLPLAVAYLVL